VLQYQSYHVVSLPLQSFRSVWSAAWCCCLSSPSRRRDTATTAASIVSSGTSVRAALQRCWHLERQTTFRRGFVVGRWRCTAQQAVGPRTSYCRALRTDCRVVRRLACLLTSPDLDEPTTVAFVGSADLCDHVADEASLQKRVAAAREFTVARRSRRIPNVTKRLLRCDVPVCCVASYGHNLREGERESRQGGVGQDRKNNLAPHPSASDQSSPSS
jgi:hypothetical protein